jgi:hypothetical protein
LVKKELLQEWTHIEVDSWRKIVQQQGKDPIEPEVSVRDRILWSVLSSKSSKRQNSTFDAENKQGPEQEDVGESDGDSDDPGPDVKVEGGPGGEGGVVSFVFLRSAAAAAPRMTLTAEEDV